MYVPHHFAIADLEEIRALDGTIRARLQFHASARETTRAEVNGPSSPW